MKCATLRSFLSTRITVTFGAARECEPAIYSGSQHFMNGPRRRGRITDYSVISSTCSVGESTVSVRLAANAPPSGLPPTEAP